MTGAWPVALRRASSPARSARRGRPGRRRRSRRPAGPAPPATPSGRGRCPGRPAARGSGPSPASTGRTWPAGSSPGGHRARRGPQQGDRLAHLGPLEEPLGPADQERHPGAGQRLLDSPGSGRWSGPAPRSRWPGCPTRSARRRWRATAAASAGSSGYSVNTGRGPAGPLRGQRRPAQGRHARPGRLSSLASATTCGRGPVVAHQPDDRGAGELGREAASGRPGWPR